MTSNDWGDDKYLDLLQNIEFGIIEVYRSDRSLIDIDAKDAIDGLTRHYRAEEEHRTPPVRALGERAERVFQSVQALCEWRLGRSATAGEDGESTPAAPISELVRCLRKVGKSIPRWSQRGGRQGYLNFVIEYLP
ncbi:MAG: hypothetical protein ABIZ80_01840 [Bryobacteraceae bacterium]